MKQSISKRLIGYFTGTLLLFAVVIGAVFAVLFTRTMEQHNRDDLQKRAEMIADTLASFLQGQSFSNSHGEHGQGGYGAFLNMVDTIAMGEVWMVDKDGSLITGHDQAVQALPPYGEVLVENAWEGNVTFSTSFSETLGSQTVTVCVPVWDQSGEVMAAVLLHAPAQGMQQAMQAGLWILLLSTVVAAFLSVSAAILLSRRFTKPIRQIGITTRKLASGQYDEKTNVQSRDEIGQLAKDVDELAQKLQLAKEQQERLEKERQAFYTDVSHELRTPVTVMRGSLEALRDGKVEKEEERQAYYDRLIDETAYMQHMVNDLLDFSRMKNPDYHLDMQGLNLPDVLSDAVRSMRRVGEKKQVSLVLTNPYPILVVTGSYEKLRQLFLILLDNAVKFSPPHTQVEVSLEPDGDAYQVRVRDHGPGIEEKDLPHIFERFYRAKSGQNTGGTGIGLAIASQIAQRHGFSLSAENCKGEGACFICRVAAATQAESLLEKESDE